MKVRALDLKSRDSGSSPKYSGWLYVLGNLVVCFGQLS